MSRATVKQSWRRPFLACLGAAACAFAAFALPVAAADAAPDAAPECLIQTRDIPTPSRFAQFAVPPGPSRTPVPPVLSTAEARRFRTVLRQGAAAGPNFAGHLTVVGWGCGASCINAAIVDALTGRVYFPDALGTITSIHVAVPTGGDYNSLRFQRDSRLLVVLGAPNENEARDGVTEFVWTGTALRLLRHVPLARLCQG